MKKKKHIFQSGKKKLPNVEVSLPTQVEKKVERQLLVRCSRLLGWAYSRV